MNYKEVRSMLVADWLVTGSLKDIDMLNRKLYAKDIKTINPANYRYEWRSVDKFASRLRTLGIQFEEGRDSIGKYVIVPDQDWRAITNNIFPPRDFWY